MASSADFTVADVLAWARTKPAGEAYDYGNPHNCALCHFLRDTGRALQPIVCPQTDTFGGWRESGELLSAERNYPREIEDALKAETFGGLVERLNALCPETPITQSNWSAIDAYLSDIEQVEQVPA